jgi:rubrerythrin
MATDEIKQLEQMIEIIVRAIPKEQAAGKLYGKTAKAAQREMTRMLFGKLHKDAEEHEQKLRASLGLLKRELTKLRHQPESVPEAGASCTPEHEFNVNIRRAMRISKELIELAEDGLRDANDPSCREMYKRFIDMGDEIMELAENEVEKHIKADKWD